MPRNAQKNLQRLRKFQESKAAASQYSNRINRAFSKLSLDATEHVAKALALPSMRNVKESGGCCLPNVWRYQAGHRTATGENGTTCIGRQKMKLSSKPLI